MSLGRRLGRIQVCCLIIVTGSLLSLNSAYAENNGWQFHIAPYAWLSGQKGTVATLPGLPPADIDIDFNDDILGNINSAIMVIGEARKGRFGLVMEGLYSDIESDMPTGGPYFSSISSVTKTTIGSAGIFYRLFEIRGDFLDTIGGFRYWSVDSKLTLNSGIADSIKVSNKENWLDLTIGLKGLMALGNSNFYISGFFILGGFDTGSDFMWDANLNLGYNWTNGFSMTMGYRYFDVDYEKNSYVFDVSQSGPILGLSWRF